MCDNNVEDGGLRTSSIGLLQNGKRLSHQLPIRLEDTNDNDVVGKWQQEEEERDGNRVDDSRWIPTDHHRSLDNGEFKQKMSTGYVIVYTTVLWTNVATSLKNVLHRKRSVFVIVSRVVPAVFHVFHVDGVTRVTFHSDDVTACSRDTPRRSRDNIPEALCSHCKLDDVTTF